MEMKSIGLDSSIYSSTDSSIDSNIYSVCIIIHKTARVGVEFIGNNRSSSFNLFNTQIPHALQASRKQTNLFIHNYLDDKGSNDYICHTDNNKLSYIAVGLWEKTFYKGTIIAGPFLSNIPDDAFISSIIEINKLTFAHRIQLHQYYKGLTIFDISDFINIGHLMVNLVSNPFIQGNALFSENKNSNIDKKEKNDLREEDLHSDIELRYKQEKDLLHAVEKGSKEEALGLRKFFQFSAKHRVPDNPLRAYKNLAFVSNTLLRVAAERGGVSPVYIHNLSDEFAITIENISSIAELENLQIKMVSEYCDLVTKMSTAGYSPIIRNAINYVNLNFDSTLSLNIIAENIRVNASHLSRQFKKETNLTITEFIHNRRIKEAKFLIEKTKSSITEIALLVGFENHNYFCTVFKQLTSLTPREYLNKCVMKK